jgi:large subunit ribosomal protein L25
MERVHIAVEAREVTGSSGARAVRRAGKIPGVFYGNGREPEAIAIDARALREALTGDSGRHAVIDVTSPASKTAVPAILKDYQLDRVRDTLTHIDLLEIRMDQTISSATAVVLVGEAAGVKLGGVLDQPTHEVAIEALPTDLVDRIEVDVSALEIGQSLKVSDLVPPPGITITADSDLVVASVIAPRAAEEPTAEVEGEEGAVPEAGAETAEAEGE